MQQFHKFITWRLCVAQHVFGRLPAHHQEHTTAQGVSGFYRWREAAGALLVVVWQIMTNSAPATSLQQ